MKASEFKTLIKEAVREVIREELMAQSQPSIPTPSTKPQQPIASPIAETRSSNPIMNMLEETRRTMTQEDYRSVINMDSSHAQGFPTNAGMPMQGGSSVGLDISQLPFVTKASAILKRSNELGR